MGIAVFWMAVRLITDANLRWEARDLSSKLELTPPISVTCYPHGDIFEEDFSQFVYDEQAADTKTREMQTKKSVLQKRTEAEMRSRISKTAKDDNEQFRQLSEHECHILNAREKKLKEK